MTAALRREALPDDRSEEHAADRGSNHDRRGGEMNPTVYVETSVVSYLTARPSRDVVIAAYQEVTREWWRSAPNRFVLYASALVMSESRSGDPEAARARLHILETLPLLDATGPAVELTETLLDRGAVPRTAVEDAAHIAIAAANGVDYLVTWNFRHIANATMRSRIEDVCRRSGYGPPVICTPSELVETRHAADAD